KEIHGKRGHVGLYGGIVALGFAWWTFIFLKYGSLAPAEFIGHVEGKAPFTSPYIENSALRHWGHVWLYFLAICPLFVLYPYGAAQVVWTASKKPRRFCEGPPPLRLLIALNAASILSVLAFITINIVGGTHDWALRHNLPFFSVAYITLGVMTTNALRKGNPRLNAVLVTLVFFTLVEMSFSTYNSMMAEGNLSAIPALLMWIPGLAGFFH
ncbi:MAG: hypothetical protein ACE5GQ_11995, partial [Nitrospinales bacterium]